VQFPELPQGEKTMFDTDAIKKGNHDLCYPSVAIKQPAVADNSHPDQSQKSGMEEEELFTIVAVLWNYPLFRHDGYACIDLWSSNVVRVVSNGFLRDLKKTFKRRDNPIQCMKTTC